MFSVCLSCVFSKSYIYTCLNYVILVGLAVGSGCAGVDYAWQFIFALWWVIVDI